MYNDIKLFKYINHSLLKNDKNSCWLDCFIILYIYVFRKIIIEKIEKEEIENPNIMILNEFITFIIQNDNNKNLYVFDLYNHFISGIEDKNFLLLDKNKIGCFNPIDMAYKLFENSNIFCIKCKMNSVCTGKCNASFGCNVDHFSSPILPIPMLSILNDKYDNPMNIVFEEYFNVLNREFNDFRCKEGIIKHHITTYYNEFCFTNILIFLIDNLDFDNLKGMYFKIKTLFNHVIIIDNEEYDIVGYYLLSSNNHFIVLFQNIIEEEKLNLSSRYLYDDLYDVIFQVTGSIDIILEYCAIHAIILLKNKFEKYKIYNHLYF